MRLHTVGRGFVAGVVTCGLVSTAFARQVDVTNPTELLAALGAATKGDEIVLADGTYALTGASCSANGTAAEPIVVRAATPLGAHVEFDALEGFKVSGAYWTFRDLDVRGVCAADTDCEHAFHVFGDADHFHLEHCHLRDFNAELKVNAGQVGSVWQTPDDGRVTSCEVGDSHGRSTSNPVTKLNIDTGDRWIVSDNYLHDSFKDGGDGISYLAFMKSGGNDGVFERNLAVCSKDTTGGTRIGLSFGGGGTGAAFCAPAYDASTPCSVEHTGGTIRNNVIVNCSDVGVYLNRAKNTLVLHNTLIATGGVDYRFDTTSGTADGNLLAGVIRARDGAALTKGQNRESVTAGDFAGWYTNPLTGDLSLKGDVSALIGQIAARAEVTDDYCARPRPAGARTVGALEHSLGSCNTVPPPGNGGTVETDGGTTPGSGGAPGSGNGGTAGASGVGGSTATAGGGTSGTAGASASAGGGVSASAGGAATTDMDGGTPSGTSGSKDDRGCGCRVGTTPSRSGALAAWLAVAGLALLRRRKVGP